MYRTLLGNAEYLGFAVSRSFSGRVTRELCPAVSGNGLVNWCCRIHYFAICATLSSHEYAIRAWACPAVLTVGPDVVKSAVDEVHSPH